MKKSLLCACAVCLLMVTAVIPPQVYGKASVEEENTTGPGWILGPFSISPKISLAGGYDSNIYATRHDKISDRFMVLAPSIEVNSTWKTHKLKLSTGAAVNRFDKYSSEDTEDYWLDGSGRYDLDTQNNIFGGVSFSQEHEERGSPDDAAGLEPCLLYTSPSPRD